MNASLRIAFTALAAMTATIGITTTASADPIIRTPPANIATAGDIDYPPVGSPPIFSHDLREFESDGAKAGMASLKGFLGFDADASVLADGKLWFHNTGTVFGRGADFGAQANGSVTAWAELGSQRFLDLKPSIAAVARYNYQNSLCVRGPLGTCRSVHTTSATASLEIRDQNGNIFYAPTPLASTASIDGSLGGSYPLNVGKDYPVNVGVGTLTIHFAGNGSVGGSARYYISPSQSFAELHFSPDFHIGVSASARLAVYDVAVSGQVSVIDGAGSDAMARVSLVAVPDSSGWSMCGSAEARFSASNVLNANVSHTPKIGLFSVLDNLDVNFAGLNAWDDRYVASPCVRVL